MELSIDSASELASISLSREGVVIAERSWRCRRNHTQELLPAIDELLTQTGVATGDLTAVFVCIGPGMYTGLRVGVSVGKGLARALGLPMVGVGRLALDAYPHREFAGDVAAIHKAGRGDLAWAAYRGDPPREAIAPTLSTPDELAGAVSELTLFVGEIDDKLRAILAAKLGALGAFSAEPEVGRAVSLAVLGQERLAAGGAEEAALVRLVYLRPPVAGPQPA